MTNLDDQEALKKLDPNQVAESIPLFSAQVEQAWDDVEHLEIPETYKNATQVVVAGMGGSTLGADVLRNLFKEELRVPLEIINHYQLPGYVGENTLVVLISYSGTTEEVLAAGEEAVAKKAKVLGVTEGKQLGEFLRNKGAAVYIFQPKNNPSGQPRLGTGYTFTGILALLSKLGYLPLGADLVKRATQITTKYDELLLPSVKTELNVAKQLANKLVSHGIIIVGAEFLSGNAHIFANQINENAKNFAAYFLLPELNHHLLEGLTNPKAVISNFHFIFLESDLYSAKLKKRLAVTKEVLEKQNINFSSLQLSGDNKLTQTLKGIIFSSWTSYYLGCLYGVDASQIPWVDYFKKRLAED